MADNIDEIMGCGKISLANVTKLIKRDGGASKYEIMTYVFLSQIADRTGKVEQYRTKQLSGIIGCDPRTVFEILKNMETKGLIRLNYYKDQNWSGIRDIKLTGNDFSNVVNFKKHRYISTFYKFFDMSDESNVKRLNGLTLYAIRLLLLILTKYNPQNGLRVSHDRLRRELGLEKRSLIDGYMRELETILGSGFYHSSKRERLNYGNIYISPRVTMLVPERSPSDRQMSYFKHHLKNLMENENMTITKEGSFMEYANYLFSSIYSFMKSSNIKYRQIEEKMIQSFQTDGGFIGWLSCYHAANEIKILCNNG